MPKSPEEIVTECEVLKHELERVVDGLRAGSLSADEAQRIKQHTEARLHELLTELQNIVAQEKS